MSKIEIRSAQSDDAESISVLLMQLGYDTPPSKVIALIEAPDNVDRIVVAVLNDRVVAVVSMITFTYFPSAEKLCRITAIVVDEVVRGMGVGTTLIDYVKALASAEQCSAVELTTSFRREKTQAYYESIGFQKTSYKYVQRL